MPAVCLAFLIHQPHVLRRYSIFDASPQYVDRAATAKAVRGAARHAYGPTTKVLIDLAHKLGKEFKVALGISGTAVELLETHAPEILQQIHALAATGCVEFLGQPYHASLSALYSRAEFAEQMQLHRQMIKRLFGAQPKVFANTELIYSNDVGRAAAELGFDAVFGEAVENVLASRSAAFVFGVPGTAARLLLRHGRLSDAVGRRFADATSPDFPLTDQKFADELAKIGGHVCNLVFDMESFGLWQPRSTGVLEFLAALPAKLVAANNPLVLPSECVARFTSAGDLDTLHMTSWSGPGRDLASWLGNAMQVNAQQELYRLEAAVKARGNPDLLRDFRQLSAADYAWAMATRHGEGEEGRRSMATGAGGADAESPYDAYINFMNVIENIKARARG